MECYPCRDGYELLFTCSIIFCFAGERGRHKAWLPPKAQTPIIAQASLLRIVFGSGCSLTRIVRSRHASWRAVARQPTEGASSLHNCVNSQVKGQGERQHKTTGIQNCFSIFILLPLPLRPCRGRLPQAGAIWTCLAWLL